MNEGAVATLGTEAWARRRHRARQLLEGHAFARGVLQLYEALLDVQEPAFVKARDDRPEPARVAVYAVIWLRPEPEAPARQLCAG